MGKRLEYDVRSILLFVALVILAFSYYYHSVILFFMSILLLVILEHLEYIEFKKRLTESCKSMDERIKAILHR